MKCRLVLQFYFWFWLWTLQQILICLLIFWQDSFFMNFPSLTPWNVDLYCNSNLFQVFDYELCNKPWLATYLLWQDSFFINFYTACLENIICTYLKKINHPNSKPSKSNFLHLKIYFCWWIKRHDLLWNPTNFEAIFLLKIRNRLMILSGSILVQKMAIFSYFM